MMKLARARKASRSGVRAYRGLPAQRARHSSRQHGSSGSAFVRLHAHLEERLVLSAGEFALVSLLLARRDAAAASGGRHHAMIRHPPACISSICLRLYVLRLHHVVCSVFALSYISVCVLYQLPCRESIK